MDKRCLEFCEGLGKVILSVFFTKTKTATKVAVPPHPQPFQKIVGRVGEELDKCMMKVDKTG